MANNYFALKYIDTWLKANGFIEEYKFHPKRKWRFDYAHIENKIAIELEGGVWTRGRHVRPLGYKGDMQKYNQAAKLGWKVLRYSYDMSDEIFDDLEDMI